MIDGTAKPLAARNAIVLACLLSAGCACLQRGAPPAEPAIARAPAAAVPTEPVVTAQSTAVTPPDQQDAETTLATAPATKSPEQPVAPPATQPVPPTAPEMESRAAAPKAPAAVTAPRTASPPAVAPAPATPASPLPKAAAVPVSPRPSPAPLDFKALEARLRQTRAIGVFTKLSLKNQVDDLLARFSAYHQRRGGATLAELRRNYDMLLLKVLSLLQDTDPPLARDIVKSRAAMWSILEDPRKFTEFNRMAGATS